MDQVRTLRALARLVANDQQKRFRSALSIHLSAIRQIKNQRRGGASEKETPSPLTRNDEEEPSQSFQPSANQRFLNTVQATPLDLIAAQTLIASVRVSLPILAA